MFTFLADSSIINAFQMLVLRFLGRFCIWKWYLLKENLFAVLVASFILAFDLLQKLIERIVNKSFH